MPKPKAGKIETEQQPFPTHLEQTRMPKANGGEITIVDTKGPHPPAHLEKTRRTAPALEFLPVPFTDAEILLMAETMARQSTEKQNIEEQFEVVKLDFKHQLENIDASLRSIYRKISKRSHYENVDCFYILEEPTRDEKTLVRRDTGEIVRVVPMAAHDYQDRLPAVMTTDAVDKADTLTLTAPENKETKTPAPVQ
jgi:hypothetical protein